MQTDSQSKLETLEAERQRLRLAAPQLDHDDIIQDQIEIISAEIAEILKGQRAAAH